MRIKCLKLPQWMLNKTSLYHFINQNICYRVPAVFNRAGFYMYNEVAWFELPDNTSWCCPTIVFSKRLNRLCNLENG